jgi:hypothetical protein
MSMIRFLAVAAALGLGVIAWCAPAQATSVHARPGITLGADGLLHEADWIWRDGRRYWREPPPPRYYRPPPPRARYFWDGRHYENRRWDRERGRWYYW